MATQGKPTAICGPAGVGKATLCLELITMFPGVFQVVGSYTTRDPKPEIHGKEYEFCTHDEFKQYVADGKIMEHNNYTGKNLYGTSKESHDKIVASGKIPLFDIDINGALQLKKFPGMDDLQIFFLECELDEQKRRLEGRGVETAEQIASRLETGKEELERAPQLKSQGEIHQLIPYGKGAERKETALKLHNLICKGVEV